MFRHLLRKTRISPKWSKLHLVYFFSHSIGFDDITSAMNNNKSRSLQSRHWRPKALFSLLAESLYMITFCPKGFYSYGSWLLPLLALAFKRRLFVVMHILAELCGLSSSQAVNLHSSEHRSDCFDKNPRLCGRIERMWLIECRRSCERLEGLYPSVWGFDSMQPEHA